MNRRLFQFIFTLSFLAGNLYGEQNIALKSESLLIETQLEKLEDLIDISKQHQSVLNILKTSIQKYQNLQSEYMKNNENNETLYEMIKEASTILDIIKQYQLIPLFDPAFISELTVVSKPAAKLGLPKL